MFSFDECVPKRPPRLQKLPEASGTIQVAEHAVRLEILLPNLLALMAGKLKGRLQKEGQLLLEKK